jgi:hypothetical protein
MFSGKAAVSDLLREFKGIYLPYYRNEFDLIRVPHGLFDLKKSFDNWSPIITDSAIREFKHLSNIIARSPSGINKLYQVGFGYEKRYPGFSEKTKHFIDNIVDISWQIKWPYQTSRLCPWDVFWLKLKSKIIRQPPWPYIEYCLCSGDKLILHARKYVDAILAHNVDANKFNTIVTHNALGPYNPEAGFCFFENVKSIVIDRDVRDIYLTGVTYSKGFNDNVPMYSKISGAFDIDIFVLRQEILQKNTKHQESEGVLRIMFEDLVLNYKSTVEKIMEFLEIDSKNHIYKMKFFNPNISKSNIGLWKNAGSQYQDNIKVIEERLNYLCYR